LGLLTFLDPERRCPVCFSSDGATRHHAKTCLFRNSPLKKLVSVFEGEGPALKLAYNFTEERPYLARGIAAYMAAFWLRGTYPGRDLVIPLPVPFGFDQNALVAKEFAKITGIPFARELGLTVKKAGTQVFLGSVLRDPAKVHDKNVLLICMSQESGERILDAASAIHEGAPSSIYALTLI